ncbi:MAG TPA: methyltransferase domain-containing protein [Vicinamibacterales bacterium]|nr:methyltransferase domain-containing protein [Vicinamibacterales bacterium]
MRSFKTARFLTLAGLVMLGAGLFAWAQRGTIATERIFDAISLTPGLTVCEIGAGDGDLSVAAARIVGETGRVLTSELGDSQVRRLETRVAASNLPQITVVAGEAAATNFPDAACGALFMRNVYHHFADPAAMNRSMLAALKPGARVAVVDFGPAGTEADRPADRAGNRSHGVSAGSVTRELTEAGFEAVTAEAATGQWFMVVARKPGSGVN